MLDKAQGRMDKAAQAGDACLRSGSSLDSGAGRPLFPSQMSLLGAENLPASLRSYAYAPSRAENGFTPSTPTTKPKRALQYETDQAAQTHKVSKTGLTPLGDGIKVHTPPCHTQGHPCCVRRAVCDPHCVRRRISQLRTSPCCSPRRWGPGTPVDLSSRPPLTCIVLYRMSTTQKMAFHLRNHSRTVECSRKIHPCRTHRLHCRQVAIPRT